VGILFAYGQTGSGKTFTVSALEELVAETLMNGKLEGERKISVCIVELAGNSAFGRHLQLIIGCSQSD
jgi:kinesin family protein 2/24